jgi:hypothetical protein
MEFEIKPSPGYRIADVKVDGESVGAVPSYMFERVTRDHTIMASFAANTYTIIASSGPNGVILPTGEVVVRHGDSFTFKIKPSQGYSIEDVEVDGESVGAVSSYAFELVTCDRTIVASFTVETSASYTIKASSGPNGSISPTGSMSVTHGDRMTFTIKPNSGYRIADVRVDGRSVGAVSRYTIKDVTRNRMISATFESEPLRPPSPIPERAKLLNQNSSKYLAVAAADTSDGGNIIIWEDFGQMDVRWALEPRGKDRYKIRNLNSGKYLAVAGASTKNGGNVIQWSDIGQQDILWDFQRVGSSCYKIRNVNSGKYLAVSGGSTDSGGNVIQWQDMGQNDIVWCLK